MPEEATPPDVVRGVEMPEADIEAFLYEQGHGTLSLAANGEAYAIPVSFGYDGSRLFMSLLRFGEDSKKLTLLEETEQACLTTYAVEDQFQWKSVVLRGPIESISAEHFDHMTEVMDDNAWFPHFQSTDPMTGVFRMKLEIEEATGRRGSGFQD